MSARRMILGVAVAAALIAAPGATLGTSHDPVLLVHGWRAVPSAWDVMVTRFVDEGAGRNVVAIDLPGEDNVANGRAIQDLVVNQLGWGRFDLVGVSMGGLSARYYVKSLGGAAQVDAYVGLGTPQYGIWAACLLSSSQGGQMCPSSSFLRSLNRGDDTPAAVRYLTLWGTSDTTVPQSATKLDGGACFATVPGVVHTAYEEDAAVFAAVVTALDGGCPGTFK
jgi:triacylglycerol lipase